jgi:hypothetical protein
MEGWREGGMDESIALELESTRRGHILRAIPPPSTLCLSFSLPLFLSLSLSLNLQEW